jgi:hypothetical protein
MKEAGIQPLVAELNELKEIESGIWALGSMLKQANALRTFMDNDLDSTAGARCDSGRSRLGLAARGAEPARH